MHQSNFPQLRFKEFEKLSINENSLADLIETCQFGNPDIKEFETSIFTGEYITPLGDTYLEDLEISRQDEVKAQREKAKA